MARIAPTHLPSLKEIEGKKRVVINNVYPEIEGGSYAIKRCIGEKVIVEADIFADGHDELTGCLLFRHESQSHWGQTPLQPLANDRWQGSFSIEQIGKYVYTLNAWINDFTSWRQKLRKKIEANQNVDIDLLIGVNLLKQAAAKVPLPDKKYLEKFITELSSPQSANELLTIVLDQQLSTIMSRSELAQYITRYNKELPIIVDRPLANFSAWYELFPRSWSQKPSQHGSFQDVINHLPYIKKLGFDIIYLPPIHPIGTSNRKGKNNSITPSAKDPGSLWAIGSEEGGHTAIHPQLGNTKDFRRLLVATKELGMELALDYALQCSPDHPYLKEHPEWFKKRPDGTLQYAENPPKKYQDIYPLDFSCDAWQSLWQECLNILLFWINLGVKIFRVDNPHTKPFIFWQWLIEQVKQNHPEVMFLSEAFTRPKVMYQLAKLGFTQSYTYFTWRNTKTELTDYFNELNSQPTRDIFRPNLWPNTPDILHKYLQEGKTPAFITRFILAATLGNNYGIYGPAFELCVNTPLKSDSEEYLDSEKYEIKPWSIYQQLGIQEIIAKVNAVRRQHKALQNMQSLRFHWVDNSEILCFSKQSEDNTDIILVVVNLDFKFKQSGWINLNLSLPAHNFKVHDLLTDVKYTWKQQPNYVELDPNKIPAHLFHIELQ